jgi:hypothetical protein
MHAEMLDLLKALGILICSGLNGHQRGCGGGKWVGGLQYAQACDCAWILATRALCRGEPDTPAHWKVLSRGPDEDTAGSILSAVLIRRVMLGIGRVPRSLNEN